MADTSIVEVRMYYLKPGQREEFVELFQRHARPAQEKYGIRVLGLLVDLEDPDAVVWLRSFPTQEDRDRMKREFYGGPEWTNELETLAMPLIDRWEVVVTQAVPDALAGTLACQ